MAHLDINNRRDPHSLYLLGHSPDGPGTRTLGDEVLAECEAAARLSSRYEWPHWRRVVARLRKEANAKDQGDGQPAGQGAQENQDSEDNDSDGEDDDENEDIDPVAAADAEID